MWERLASQVRHGQAVAERKKSKLESGLGSFLTSRQ
jgi:hypothetical protein